MTPLSMLVTSDGHWVVEGSSDFFEALGDPAPDYDGSLFAVKNLGFIKFQIFNGGIVEVELHPRNVELPALLAVQQQIHSSRCKLFRIKHFDTEWHSEITSSAEHAITRLSEMCAPAVSPPPVNSKYVVQPQDYSKLFMSEDTPLRRLAQKWQMSFGYFNESVIPFAIKHRLLSRTVIAGVSRRSASPVFRFIGDGFSWMSDDYQFFGIGQQIENLPDKDYGAWLAEYYKSVAATGQPRYDVVTATIEKSPPASEAYRTRYERLLLPWKTPSEETFVSLCSRVLAGPSSAELDDVDEEDCVIRKFVKSS